MDRSTEINKWTIGCIDKQRRLFNIPDAVYLFSHNEKIVTVFQKYA